MQRILSVFPRKSPIIAAILQIFAKSWFKYRGARFENGEAWGKPPSKRCEKKIAGHCMG
jgi:hypothetical protein